MCGDERMSACYNLHSLTSQSLFPTIHSNSFHMMYSANTALNPHKKPTDYMTESANQSFGAKKSLAVDDLIESEIRELEKEVKTDYGRASGKIGPMDPAYVHTHTCIRVHTHIQITSQYCTNTNTCLPAFPYRYLITTSPLPYPPSVHNLHNLT